MDRRFGIKGLLKKEGWLCAFPLLFCFLAAGASGLAESQSPIISNPSVFGNKNKSAVYFQQAPAPIRLRSLEETQPAEETQLVDVVIPPGRPVTLNRRNITVPFPASAYDASSVASKGLLYSDDRGANWHEYGAKRPVSDNDAYPFEAPRDGEYWFALHLIRQDGTSAASSAQKYVIDTGSGVASAAQSGEGGDRMVQGLLSLTQKNETVQQTSAGGDALTARLNENGAAADPFSSSKNETADVPFPGKINQIESGTSSSGGKPALSVTWFPPYQCGMTQSEGKVTLQRAPAPDGPWTPVTADSVDLDINGRGYWFEAGENDNQPFYLRTVSTVKVGSDETQWIDTVPDPISFPGSSSSSNSAPSVAEIQEPRVSDEIKPWTDSGESSGERKVAGLDNRDSIVDKTSSVNSSASAPDVQNLADRAQSESRQVGRPQLTDPHQLSVNPIFRYGFGVFTGKDRSGNRLPDYSGAGSSPAYANQQPQQQSQEFQLPPPLPPRPIWMTKQEYEEHQRAYEMEVQQIRYAQAQREAAERQREMMKNTAQGWNPNAQQATVTDQSGTEFRISEGSVLYDDGNGNLSSTPPAQFNNAALPEMTFPDQQFMNVGQPVLMGGGETVVGGQSVPTNGFGDPYTMQEQTIDANADTNAGMTGLPNQSIIQNSNLPPRPDQQQ